MVFQAQKNNQELHPKDTQVLDSNDICPQSLFFLIGCA